MHSITSKGRHEIDLTFDDCNGANQSSRVESRICAIMMHGNLPSVLNSDVIVTLILARLERQALASVALTCRMMHQIVQEARGQLPAARRDSFSRWPPAWELVCKEPYGAVALLQLLLSNPFLCTLRITASSMASFQTLHTSAC
jgi:hypothetical protein